MGNRRISPRCLSTYQEADQFDSRLWDNFSPEPTYPNVYQTGYEDANILQQTGFEHCTLFTDSNPPRNDICHLNMASEEEKSADRAEQERKASHWEPELTVSITILPSSDSNSC